MKPKPWRTIAVLALLVLFFFLVLTPGAPAHPYYAGVTAPQVIAHQGGDGVWPGDTLFAFERAVEIGADVLEMDAHITKDGHIILMHDETVDDTTDGTGLIEEMTLDELKQLDAAYDWSKDDGQTYPYRGQGIQVTALAEVFEKFPQMRYAIEIKKSGIPVEQPLCDLIRQYNMQDKVLIASFHDEVMQNFRATCPEVATSASRGEVTKFVILGKVFLSGLVAPGYEAIQPPFDPQESYNIPIMTKRFIREAHAKNIKVEPWTVDDPELMERYIEWGVDGII
ncbi:MAG: glycerophosphodiester phosphodiesterase, partial [Anaerolineales bacterium]|nr:glycerophosphodiester phosphodiesterase [Anaerolineales bacterium]